MSTFTDNKNSNQSKHYSLDFQHSRTKLSTTAGTLNFCYMPHFLCERQKQISMNSHLSAFPQMNIEYMSLCRQRFSFAWWQCQQCSA